MDKVRVDKFLWAVRIFKTRSLASDACAKGRVLVDGAQTKPSKEIKGNETITVRKPPVMYSYKVKSTLKSRVSAKLVSEYIEDITSIEELDKLKINETLFFKRDRGTGRPTKRDRRIIDKLHNDN